ncbi:TetR/AcrR family transcriptional regulator [Pseudomonas oryzae]|uniref:Transcriptional regulator, TetR family n=1 Tax=Pseudomonas oryzae TaxID=1392877 RepID=A0A1H1SKV4_9PSED|nr:transcriptional regulator, TetR family [Pseudomonas oryzae]
MAQSETVERILDAAEQLFAERGFTETSLRSITGKAGVNLAAVNYHFGSKKALIHEVFARFLTPFCQALDAELTRRQQVGEDDPGLEELLELLVVQARSVESRLDNDLAVFMRLLGLALIQEQGHVRQYLDDKYGKVFRRYMQLLNAVAPPIPPEELFWRVHFMLGAAAFTMAGIKPLGRIADSKFAVQTSSEQVLHLLVPFMAAGLRADAALPGAPRMATRTEVDGRSPSRLE